MIGQQSHREQHGIDADTVKLDWHGEGRIALVTLNRPHVMNAFNTAMSLAIANVLDELSDEMRCRVVIITGAGDRAFCAGGDLKERQGMPPDQWTRQHRLFERTHWKLRNFRKPIFAAVNGVALAGGNEMAMSTDFIVCSDNAAFGQTEVKRGFQPGAGGTQLLPRKIPRGMAMQMLLTGEMITAEEAYRIGLVNCVYPRSKLLEGALELAGRIAENSPSAVQLAKASARRGLDTPLEHGIEMEIETHHTMVDHPDRYEGITAFNERREPQFRDVL